MAKKYRRRYRRKGRWSANIQEFNSTSAASVGSFYVSNTLVTNPVQNNNTVSQQFTVKNIEATFEFETTTSTGSNYVENLTIYVMYRPQGMTITTNFNTEHPEYIMNYRFIGNPMANTSAYRNPLKIKTRLSRRLQTGDQIILYIKGYNPNNTNTEINLKGIVRWWTKAN